MLEQTHWKVSGKNSAAQILGLDLTAVPCGSACGNLALKRPGKVVISNLSPYLAVILMFFFISL